MLACNPLCCLFSMSHFLLMTLLDQSPSLQFLILSCYQNLHLILIATFFAMNLKTPMHVFNHLKPLKSLKNILLFIRQFPFIIWPLIPARPFLHQVVSPFPLPRRPPLGPSRRILFPGSACHWPPLPSLFLLQAQDSPRQLSEEPWDNGESCRAWRPAPDPLGPSFQVVVQSVGLAF